MATHPASTASQRKVGRALRRRRELAKLTLADVAERMEWSQSKVSRIETGHTSISSRDVRHLMEMYGAEAGELDELVERAKEARQKARQKTWWYPYSAVLVTSFVSLEEESTSIRAYYPLLVPGLLQTREYAEATLRASAAPTSNQTVMERIDIRMRRQSLITRHDNPISFWAVLDEAVLCRPVGGEEVMRAQLRSLYEASLRRNVTIQVLPFAKGEHPGMAGVFTILGFPGPDDTPIVYAEHETGGLFLEKAEEYQRYNAIFDALQKSALSPEESSKLLANLAEEPSWTSRPMGPTRVTTST